MRWPVSAVALCHAGGKSGAMMIIGLYLAALLAAPASAKPPVTQPPTPAAPDGKVTGLNVDTYSVLQAIKKRNPGAFTENSANELATAIRKDSRIDDIETDLLREMTQSMFRSITITPAGAASDSTDKIITYPVSGNAKKVLLYVINPPLDFAAEWAKPDRGWNLLVTDYKISPERKAAVLAFVTEEMAKKWEVSNMGNGYKPLRDEIAKLYGQSNSLGADTNAGRTLLYDAMNMVDRNAKDSVPDFLYNWVRPGGYL
jgi:hypothetical protein